MADYWTAKAILDQTASELGLPKPQTLVGLEDVQSSQLMALLNSAGNELMLYYPWEQFLKEWSFYTTPSDTVYSLPTDYNYFLDQTQWDRTDHWPLLGPKSAQEWAWLKGAVVASLPRIRYRIQGGQLLLFPAPNAVLNFAMEYVTRFWATTQISGVETPTDMLTQDGDVVMYNPWLLIKFVKFKFYELKGFQTSGVNADFMRVFQSLTGKDTGARILSLNNQYQEQYINARSVPDGSWHIN